MESSGELITFITIGVSLMLLLAMTFVLFFSFSQNKLRKEQFKVQQTKLEYQEKLLHSTILTQEKERERIAKDLHDEVGSKLNVIHLYLHQLRKKAPDAQSSIQDMSEVLNDTLQTSRRISHDLMPPTLADFGLAVAIEEVCDRFRTNSQQAIVFDVQGERPEKIDNLVELHLFRILQELISNTLKYAEADEIRIQLTYSPETLSLIYSDNGKGFDATALENQKGLGMKNIDSRLQMVQGHYTLKTAPGAGMRVEIEVGIGG